MKSIFSLSCAAIAVLAASCTASDPTRTELLEARWLPVTYKGCYSSAGSLKENGTYLYQTQDYCQQSMCGPAGYSVEATSNSTYCYCGSEVPSSSLLIDDSLCNSPCAGFGNDTCRHQCPCRNIRAPGLT
jgi:cell wall integrity and stress response component